MTLKCLDPKSDNTYLSGPSLSSPLIYITGLRIPASSSTNQGDWETRFDPIRKVGGLLRTSCYFTKILMNVLPDCHRCSARLIRLLTKSKWSKNPVF